MRCELNDALADQVRLAALQAADLLDTPPDEEFDRLARLASHMVRAPVALVTLVTPERQYFKSCIGLQAPWSEWRQTPLSHSFCQHVVASCRPLVIPDARKDERLKDNLAIRDLGVIAYLGIPLRLQSGACLGSFCVIDQQPRQWTQEDISSVATLAQSVVTEIELRRHQHSLRQIVEERTRLLQQELERSRRLEDQLREALHEAQAAYETKNRLIANLSHELRTPLTPVLLQVSLMESDPDLHDEQRSGVAMIREHIEVEARLINDLLMATDLTSWRLRPDGEQVDVASAVERVCQQLGTDAQRKNITFDRRPADAPIRVAGNRVQLEDALARVLGNAVKFSEPGGAVRIQMRINGDGPEGVRWGVIDVIDEGAGIEPDRLPFLFTPFEQESSASARRYGGLGLGLAIAKAIVEGHGGRVQARSEGKGHGVTFSVWLPLMAEQATA